MRTIKSISFTLCKVPTLSFKTNRRRSKWSWAIESINSAYQWYLVLLCYGLWIQVPLFCYHQLQLADLNVVYVCSVSLHWVCFRTGLLIAPLAHYLPTWQRVHFSYRALPFWQILEVVPDLCSDPGNLLVVAVCWNSAAIVLCFWIFIRCSRMSVLWKPFFCWSMSSAQCMLIVVSFVIPYSWLPQFDICGSIM